jgi:hypothetical protein
MIRGGCLCGDVRFEIERRPQRGLALPLLDVPQGARRRIRYLCSGKGRRFPCRVRETLEFTRYRSSAGIVRTFCARCGSTLQWLRDRKPEMSSTLRSGVLDDDPGVRPRVAHLRRLQGAVAREIDHDLRRARNRPMKPTR